MKRILLALAALAALADVARAQNLSVGYGNALSLDGASTVELAPPTTTRTRHWTVEAWIKTTNSMARQVILAQKGGTGTGRAWLWIQNGYLGTDLGGRSLTARTAITSNTWHHVALVYDRVGRRVVLYADFVAVGVGTAFVEAASGNFVIGADEPLDWADAAKGMLAANNAPSATEHARFTD